MWEYTVNIGFPSFIELEIVGGIDTIRRPISLVRSEVFIQY